MNPQKIGILAAGIKKVLNFLIMKSVFIGTESEVALNGQEVKTISKRSAKKLSKDMKKPKILMIFTEWAINEYRREHNLYGGTGYYRIIKPAQFLKQWYDVDVVGRDINRFGSTPNKVWKKIFTTYDLVYPRHVDNPKAASDMLACGEIFGKPVLVDMDDNYKAVRESSPAYEVYYPGSQKNAIVGAVLSLAKGVTVSTEPLKEVYKNLNKNIYVLPNCNDINDWQFKPQKWNDGLIRIGWQGSVTHDEDLEIMTEPIMHIFKKYPNVRWEVLGGITEDKVESYKKKFGIFYNRVLVHFGIPAWQGWPEKLASLGWDIGVAPLTDNEFTICKSHIKWMEYAMYKIPCIASYVYPYYQDIQKTKTIQHGKTGFLAKNKEDWIKYLELLIENVKIRKRIGNNAYQYIKENWQWSQHIHKWKEVIDYYLSQHYEPKDDIIKLINER